MTATQQSTTASPEVAKVTAEVLDKWATDPAGPVALHLKQKLVAVEAVDSEESVIYPPTYADIGYNIDTLSDGTRVALIDSVGSQANRLEPIFIAAPGTPRDQWLVPQIDIVLHSEPCGECDACKKAANKKKRKEDEEWKTPRKEKRSILELAHRVADAVVQSSPTLLSGDKGVARAFQKLHQTGDAGLLCAIAPTSLVFGVWDSRGGTGEKRPRLVRSIIRAWDVDTLHAAAQFNSVWKGLDEEQQDALKKDAKAKKTKLSTKGFADAPATFRKVSTTAARYMQEFRDGSPNPERRVLGGVVVHGRIERELTVNLVALRGIRGNDEDETKHIHQYLLGLALVAATTDMELFLREGCHLRYAGDDTWRVVPRRGDPNPVDLSSEKARSLIRTYASDNAVHFREKWPTGLTEPPEHAFNLDEAKKLLVKKEAEETPDEE